MALHHFTVTQLRTAATCPRIHYFDVERARREGLSVPSPTRVWLPGQEARIGGGALFHTVVERFNQRAAQSPEIREVMESASDAESLRKAFLQFANRHCIDLEKLSRRSVDLRRALTATLQAYFSELADMVSYALARGTPAREVREQVFGDRRRRVDVTFRVGDGDEAHVSGAIDYVFYDWRISSHRIVEYKLLPPSHQNKDLFQVSAYAMMHHHQHGTRPTACVFYLHPKREMVERKWSQVQADSSKVYTHLASMVGWSQYDEKTQKGLKPRGNPIYCAGCKWNKRGECELRLGPKDEGGYDTRWEQLGASPAVEVHSPPSSPVPSGETEAALEAELDEHDTPVSASAAQEEAISSKPAAPNRSVAFDQEIPEGLFLGRVPTGAPVVLPVGAIKTHIAVVGAAGSGKTWTAKCLVEEVILAGVPVLAIDPQGDLVQFLRAGGNTGLDPAESRRRAAYLDRVEPRIWTPGTSHGTRLSLDPIRLPSEADLARIDKPERRQEERESMLQAVANNLVSLASIGGEEESQRTFIYLVLEALQGRSSVLLADVVQAIGAADDLGLPSAPDQLLKKSEREKLARKLNAFVVGPGRNLFSGGAPLDLQRFITPDAPGKVPLNVVYLNALTDDDQKHFFLAALAAEIYRWMVTTLDATSGRPSLLFYIDEARDYIPAGGRKPAAKEPLIRLFTQGRKYGVGCLLCTQSPRSVDYNVFGNCSTKIVGRMEAEQDVERIGDWFTTSGPRPDWVSARKGAARGTFVARSPDMPAWLEGEAFQSRQLYSLHEGAWSPDRVERELATS